MARGAPVVGTALFYRAEYLGQLRADEHRDDGGRRFVAAEPVVVRRGRDGRAQHVLIFVYSLYDGAEEEQELRVLGRRFARI